MRVRVIALLLLIGGILQPVRASDPAPKGAISHFSGACPEGWHSYEPAAGRAIVPASPEGVNRTVGAPLAEGADVRHIHDIYLNLRLPFSGIYATFLDGVQKVADWPQPVLGVRGEADESSSELPLAKLNACEKLEDPAGVAPAGMVLFFSDLVCPAGWSPFEELNGRVLTGKTAEDEIGAFGSLLPLTDGEDRLHSHLITGRVELMTFELRIFSTCGSCGNKWARAGNGSYLGSAEDASSGLPYLQLQTCSKDAPVGPQISRAAHGVDFGERALAPGQHATLFGSEMGPREGLGAALLENGEVSRERGGVRVLVDELSAPLFFVRDDQINFQVPYEVDGRESVRIRVVRDGVAGPEREVAIAAAAPALFAWGDDPGRAIAVHADGSLNSAENPAEPGQAVIFFASGGGQTSPPGRTGVPATAPYPAPRGDVELWIGGEQAALDYAAAAPGYLGMMQINARMTNASGRATVVLKVGEAETEVETAIFGQ